MDTTRKDEELYGHQRVTSEGVPLWAWVVDDGVTLIPAKDKETAIRLALGDIWSAYKAGEEQERSDAIQGTIEDGGPDVRPLFGDSTDEWANVVPFDGPLPAWML